MNGPEDPRRNETTPLLPNHESSLDIQLEESDFVINPGHYDQILKEVATTWIADGFAREVLVDGQPVLVVNTDSLLNWMKNSLEQNALERVRSSLAVAFSLLLPPEERTEKTVRSARYSTFSLEEIPVQPQAPTLGQRIVNILKPKTVTERTQSIERALWALEQEIRQTPEMIGGIRNQLPKLRMVFLRFWGILSDGDLDAFKRNVPQFQERFTKEDDQLEEEVSILGRRAEYYGKRMAIVVHILNKLIEKITDDQWQRHPNIMEERLTLAEAVQEVTEAFPDLEQFAAKMLYVHQAIELIYAAMTESTEASIVEKFEQAEAILREIKF